MLDTNIKKDKMPCPVCNSPSFDKSYFPGSYLICNECGWEDDYVQYHDPEYEGGANDVSLNQARANYKLYKTSDPNNWVHKPNVPG